MKTKVINNELYITKAINRLSHCDANDDNPEGIPFPADDDDTGDIGSLDELKEHIRNMIGTPILDNDDEDDAFFGKDKDADDIHNEAVLMARMGHIKQARDLCISGLQRFPNNIDLIADTINYCTTLGDMKLANEYYLMLKDFPYCRWNWRAFTFAFDYLLTDDPIDNLEEIRLLIEKYKSYLPYEEKAYVAESELEEAFGNLDTSVDVLKAAINRLPNASQCALKLADKEFSYGLYEDAIKTCNYGLAASAMPNETINVPYLLFIRILCSDYMLHRKAHMGKPVSLKEVELLRGDYYHLITEYHKELSRYRNTIETRSKLLTFVTVTE